MVEKLRVEMSFNPYKEGQKILHDISIKMAIEQDQSGFLIGLLIYRHVVNCDGIFQNRYSI